MCNPAAAMLVTTLFSTGVQMYAANQQGKQQEAWQNYQAEQADADADAERQAGMVEAERIRKLGKRQKAEADAAFAGSGIDLSEGTPLDINRDISQGVEEDAYFAMVGANDRGARLNADAMGARIGAKNSRTAGRLGAATALAQGAATVATGWKTSKSGGR